MRVIERFYVFKGRVEFAAEFGAVFASSDSVLSGRDNSAPSSVAPREESLLGGIWWSTFQFGEDVGTTQEAAKAQPVKRAADAKGRAYRG